MDLIERLQRKAVTEKGITAGEGIRAAGLFPCASLGMIDAEQAETLRDLKVDSVPLNFLTPIAGPPLGRALPLRPLEILLTIAVFRFLLPDSKIKLRGCI